MTTTTPAIERGTEAVRRNADVVVLLRPLIARAVLAAALDGPELDAELAARLGRTVQAVYSERSKMRQRGETSAQNFASPL